MIAGCTCWSVDDEDRVLRSFIKDGFDRGEKSAYIVDRESREAHLKQLVGVGVNVQKAMDTGQLEVLP